MHLSIQYCSCGFIAHTRSSAVRRGHVRGVSHTVTNQYQSSNHKNKQSLVTQLCAGYAHLCTYYTIPSPTRSFAFVHARGGACDVVRGGPRIVHCKTRVTSPMSNVTSPGHAWTSVSLDRLRLTLLRLTLLRLTLLRLKLGRKPCRLLPLSLISQQRRLVCRELLSQSCP